MRGTFLSIIIYTKKSCMTRGRLFDLCDLCLKNSNDKNNVCVKLAIFFFCVFEIPHYKQVWSKYRSEIVKIIIIICFLVIQSVCLVWFWLDKHKRWMIHKYTVY
jgi:hypothetical protein